VIVQEELVRPPPFWFTFTFVTPCRDCRADVSTLEDGAYGSAGVKCTLSNDRVKLPPSPLLAGNRTTVIPNVLTPFVGTRL